VQIIAATTIWALFACFLIFPLAGLPRLMQRAAMSLLVAELIALGFWSYGSEGCDERPCALAAEAGRTAASVDVPLLAVALVLLAVYRGLRAWRPSERDSGGAAHRP
jgi:hypothetical protein